MIQPCIRSTTAPRVFQSQRHSSSDSISSYQNYEPCPPALTTRMSRRIQVKNETQRSKSDANPPIRPFLREERNPVSTTLNIRCTTITFSHPGKLPMPKVNVLASRISIRPPHPPFAIRDKRLQPSKDHLFFPIRALAPV